MTAPKPREVKVYTLEIGYVEKTSLHGHDTGVTQNDVVMKSDYDSLKADLEALVKFYGSIESWTTNTNKKEDNEFICVVPHDLEKMWDDVEDKIGGKLAREIGDRNGIKYE